VEVGTKEAVDEHTLFMIASCTKSFTAGLVATLVDEGKLGWDDPVIEHLSEFFLHDLYATRHASCRDLLAHRSALPPFTGDLLEKLGFERPDILRRLRFLRPVHTFREQADYSNPGYFAAGMVASRVGGASWEDLVRRRLFGPLGMKQSGLSFKDRQGNDNVAEAHFPSPTAGRVVSWEDHDAMGPAGVSPPASDMGLLGRMHLNQGSLDGKRVVSPAAIREMQRPPWWRRPSAELRPLTTARASASPWAGPVTTTRATRSSRRVGPARMRVVTLVPEKKLGVVVLANLNFTVLPEAVRAYVIEAYLGPARSNVQQKIHTAHEAIQKRFAAPPVREPGKKAPSSLPLERYAGTYQNDLYGKVTLTVSEGVLRWEAGPAQFGGRLEHLSYDTFLLQYPPGVNYIPEPVTFTISPSDAPRHCSPIRSAQ
jgi:CubicO group peptidase (beta-lactamase class C family)